MTKFRIVMCSSKLAKELAHLHAEIFSMSSWSEDWFYKNLRLDSISGMAVYAENICIGLLIVRYILNEAEILTLGVAPNYRRQGVADHLLKSMDWKQSESVFLEVSQRNLSAITLYEMNGYEMVGRRKSYYANGEDAIVMRKQIAS